MSDRLLHAPAHLVLLWDGVPFIVGSGTPGETRAHLAVLTAEQRSSIVVIEMQARCTITAESWLVMDEDA